MLGVTKIGEKGEWVVCWPSLYNDHRSFLNFAQALSSDHRVLIIDPPGLGLSKDVSLPPLGILELSTMGSATIETELEGASFHFVGHGTGAYVGLALAVKNSKCKTITISGAPLVNEYRSNFIVKHIGGILLRWGLSTNLAKRLIMRSYSLSNDVERGIVNVVLKGTLKDAKAATVVKLASPAKRTIEHHRELLRHVKQPLLVLAGSRDKVMLPAEQRDIARMAKLGSFRTVESGFMTFLTASAECARFWLQHKRGDLNAKD